MSRVWLIGAGPGDAELITLKAVRALALADVVLVDDLVNPAILEMARPDASIVHVGKRGGGASTPQDDIIATMLEHVQAGRSVARLKGGDPFVFGRGGEELLALRAAGIETEIISGITAGIAAPATLGVPVTHRGLSQGAVFVTGHGAGDEEPNWQALVATGMTLVVYMGIRRVEDIAGKLLGAGMPSGTPCVAIESATLPAQRQIVTSLASLAGDVRRAKLGSPAILVIGQVASLASADTTTSKLKRRLTIGIGFRRDVTSGQIEAAIHTALGPRTMSEVACIATLDSKADAPALLEFCRRHQVSLVALSAEEINACIAQHRSLARSTVAREQVGVDGVCEPCALLAAPGASLLRDKLGHDGVTVAIATTETLQDPTT